MSDITLESHDDHATVAPLDESADTTRRAYRFAVTGDSRALYRTHCAVNAGVEAALECFLSLRGGLHASLALVEDAVQRRDRMIVLVNAWFVCESAIGAPAAYVIAQPSEARLRAILVADGVSADIIDQWVDIARPTLRAVIRPDGVWVDRRAAFTAEHWSPEATGDVLLETNLLGDPWTLTDKRKAAKDLGHITGGWLSRRLGTGPGTDLDALARAYGCVVDATAIPIATTEELKSRLAAALSVPSSEEAILNAFVTLGPRPFVVKFLITLFNRDLTPELTPELLAKLHKGATRARHAAQTKSPKGARPWAHTIASAVERASGLPYIGATRANHREYAVILDHAARRLASHHSWVLRAERERIEMHAEAMPEIAPAVIAWLDAYRIERGQDSGVPAIRMTTRTINGWPQVVARWAQCADADERIDALASLQRDPEIERFGDMRLFRDLAGDTALAMWQTDGRPDADILIAYVALCERSEARKAPMVRHVDAHRHPVFVDYGMSRFRMTADSADSVTLAMLAGNLVVALPVSVACKRFAHDIAETTDRPNAVGVSRDDRLSRLATDAPTGADVRALASDDLSNARLVADRRHLERIARTTNPAIRERLIGALFWSIDVSVALPIRPLDERITNAETERRAINSTRGTLVRKQLDGIPGLRVMGVDLGWRTAAACAVIETMTRAQIDAIAVKHGIAPPAPEARSWVFVRDSDGQRQRFRRLAPDIGLDRQPHGAPWAYVEGTYAIRLPGELERQFNPVASPAAFGTLGTIAELLGCAIRSDRNLHDVQYAAMRTIRSALRRASALVKIVTDLRGSDVDKAVRAVAVWRERLVEPTTFDMTDERRLAASLPSSSDVAPTESVERLIAGLTPIVERQRAAIRRSARHLRVLVRSGERRAGGLTVARIDVLERYYRTIKAIYTAPTLDHPQGRGATEHFGQRALNDLARLRTERVRTLTSRIMEAALSGNVQNDNEKRRKTQRVNPPCHAIVIEDLSGYRPSAARAKRTNRLLRSLKSQQVCDLLTAQCTLHGVALHVVPAAYTSRLDGLTGEAGVVCERVPVDALLSDRWQKMLVSAARRSDPISQYLVALNGVWNPVTEQWGTWMRTADGWLHDGRLTRGAQPTVLIPRDVAPHFTTNGQSMSDADQNAAIGIGMSVLLDRTWLEALPYIPCGPNGEPIRTRVLGGPVELKVALIPKQTRPVNAWRRRDGQWMTTTEFWRDIEAGVCSELAVKLPARAGLVTRRA